MGGQAGSQAPTLRPNHHETTEARPVSELLRSSLPFWRQLRRVGIAVHVVPIGSIWRWSSWPGPVSYFDLKKGLCCGGGGPRTGRGIARGGAGPPSGGQRGSLDDVVGQGA